VNGHTSRSAGVVESWTSFFSLSLTCENIASRGSFAYLGEVSQPEVLKHGDKYRIYLLDGAVAERRSVVRLKANLHAPDYYE
jgi:hypothetical protein